MGKIIAKNVVTRKKGYLYYVDGKGNVCEAQMEEKEKGREEEKKEVARAIF